MDITPRLFAEHRVCDVHSCVCQPQHTRCLEDSTTGVSLLTPLDSPRYRELEMPSCD